MGLKSQCSKLNILDGIKVSTTEKSWIWGLKWLCPAEQIRFQLSSKRADSGGRTNIIRKGIPHLWGIKCKTQVEMFGRYVDRYLGILRKENFPKFFCNMDVLTVPKLCPVYKSVKHFSLRFAFDAPKVWNALPDDVHALPHHRQFYLKTYLFRKAYLP